MYFELDAEQKFQKVWELLEQGVDRNTIAEQLYTAEKSRDRMDSLRRLMGNQGYIWDRKANQYIQKNTNKNVSEQTNKVEQKQTKPKEQGLSDKEIKELRELIVIKSDLEAILGKFKDIRDIIPNIEEETLQEEYTEFQGVLKASTLQLHMEVWELLDDYCKKNKVSKKVVVNQAIWNFLNK